MKEIIQNFLSLFFNEESYGSLVAPTTFIAIALAGIVAYWFCLRIVSVFVRIVTKRTSTEWDDDLLTDKVLRAISQLAPALLVAYLLPQSFETDSLSHIWISKLTDFYILWAFIHLINSFLQALFDALDKRGRYRIHTMRGVLQMLKLFFIIIGIIIGVSILFGKSPVTIITALGASAAVLMLIFQDTILGLVAGVQLTVNDMLKKGDWIVVPKADANGEVEEISLTTVKVRNWDNSVTTIPPYTLIKDSFHNYAPMQDSNARRVCRSVYIDINSVRFLSSLEIDRLRIDGFLDDTKNASSTVNLSLLCSYIERFLSTNEYVRADLIYMVRQLQPTPNGLPVELYFFSNVTAWKEFEHIQSTIFNHVYASLNVFGLSFFQSPTSNDFKQIGRDDVK